MKQRKYTKELLEDSGLTEFKKVLTLLPLQVKYTPDAGDLVYDLEFYRSMIGKLNFLTNARPDLSFVVRTLSQFMQRPRMPHLDAWFHLLAYVLHTPGHDLILKGDCHFALKDFSDSNWAACPTTRLSVTGYLVTLGSSLISWKSKRQSTLLIALLRPSITLWLRPPLRLQG
ncbi:transmembrane signal receptor [Lithospermum erythrorhizon]